MLTFIVIGLNVVIYIVLNMFLLQNGIDVISHLDNSWMAVKFHGEYYRIFTREFDNLIRYEVHQSQIWLIFFVKS